MAHKLLFDIIGSDIDRIGRHSLFDGWTDEGELDENNPNSYAEYELFIAKPAVDWCIANGITDFTTESHKYAMQIIFIFNNIEDAMAFKIRWNNKRCKM